MWTLRGGLRAGPAYATEHCANARYSSSTSRPRFSSLRNSCTHLQDTGLPEHRPGGGADPSGHSKGPQGPPPGRQQPAPASEDPVMPRKDARTRAGPTVQPRLKGPVKAGRKGGRKAVLDPILEWAPQAQPGAGMGRIVRGPRGSLLAELSPSPILPMEIQARVTHPMWLVLREISNSRSTCVDS